MYKIKMMVAVIGLFAFFGMNAEAKLFKWVDDKGETHYGEVVPPEYADRERMQLEKGHEVKKQEKAKDTGAKEAVETPEEIEQKRRDQALLGTFSSEGEIDLARDRNLQQVNARMTSIQMRLKTAQEDLDGYQKEKDAMIKAGKPVDKVLQEQLDQAASKKAKLQDDMVKSEAEAAAIKARYAADKQRYHDLTTGGKK